MVKNTFQREGRWDSVGLDCSQCQYFNSPLTWPDKNRSISCNLHKISLSVELREDGYKEGEWICKDFKDKGRSILNAIKHFEKMKECFDSDVLYMFTKIGEDLKEVRFEDLKKI